jgi:hypothetical protein
MIFMSCMYLRYLPTNVHIVLDIYIHNGLFLVCVNYSTLMLRRGFKFIYLFHN